jgi:Ankyrin repeats (many copies)
MINETPPKYLKTFALNQPISSLKEKKGLTDLHMAVIQGDLQSAEKLLKEGVQVNALDKRKWTPFHFATLLKNTRMADLLETHGANKDILNDIGATALDLYWFTIGTKRFPKNNEPLRLQDTQGHNFTEESYERLTKSKYVENQRVTRTALIKEWRDENGPSPSERLPFLREVEQKYLTFAEGKRECHILQESCYNDAGVKLDQSAGLGIFAARNYKAGEVLGEYLGKVSEKPTRSDYAIEGNIDGRFYSNEMTRINDACPNVVLVPLSNCRGRPSRKIFLTAEPIKKGEQFCWNYGFHDVKLGPYQELRPIALRNFVEENRNLKPLILEMAINLGVTQQVTFTEFSLFEKLRYLLSTPSVFFTLILEGKLDKNTCQDIWRLGYASGCIPPDAPAILHDRQQLPWSSRNSVKVRNKAKEP